MDSNLALIQRLYKWSYLLIASGLVLLSSCNRETDVRVIDFENTIPIARPGDAASGSQPLKVAVGAMISPKDTFVYYRQLLDYLGAKLGRDVDLVQRKTYGEVSELLGKGQIDMGLICSGPYAAGKEKYGFELLATPEVQGVHFYRSYLIVNKASPIEHFEDLRGRVFAFTDPDSHTGKLVPTYWLAQIKERPETFFGKVIFTYSHDNSILAVARGLVDGAAVDGLIWEFYQHKDPSLTSATRIIRKSEPYGIPPIVVSRELSPTIKESVRKLLLSMHEDPEGKKILDELMIDRFVRPREEWYNSIRELEQRIAGTRPIVE